MPIDGSSTELLNTQNSTKKKRSHKKRRQNRKLKTRILVENESNGQSSNGMKNTLNYLYRPSKNSVHVTVF